MSRSKEQLKEAFAGLLKDEGGGAGAAGRADGSIRRACAGVNLEPRATTHGELRTATCVAYSRAGIRLAPGMAGFGHPRYA